MNQLKWVWRMALRDGRGYWRQQAFIVLLVAVGTAALVALSSTKINVLRDIEEQSKSLLGADLVLTNRQAFPAGAERLMDSIEGLKVREIQFASMVYFPETGGSRLVQVKAIQDGFPFYGMLETAPDSVSRNLAHTGGALIDDGVLLQYGASVGDSIQLGRLHFRIAGRLLSVPGESGATSALAPTIYIPYDKAEATGLLQRGSRVLYRMYLKMEDGRDVPSIAAIWKKRLNEFSIRIDTYQGRQERLGATYRNFFNFVSLLGFISLLLSSIAVGAAMTVWARQKTQSVAILRCLGSTAWKTLMIFLVEGALVALCGAVLGAMLGVALQFAIAGMVFAMLPVKAQFAISLGALMQSMAWSLLMAILFILLSLVPLRDVSPLLVMRSIVSNIRKMNPLRYALASVLVVVVGAGAAAQAENAITGIVLTLAVLGACGILGLLALGLRFLARRFSSRLRPFVWRQGLANLYRPQNQTVLLMISIGLCTFLIGSVRLTQKALLGQIEAADSGGATNLVLFDVQTDQRPEVRYLMEEYGIQIAQEIPVVTMGVARIHGRNLEDLRSDTTYRVPGWLQEIRATYRDTVFTTERVTAGFLRPRSIDSDTLWVSVEADIAKGLKLGLGDTVVFDVQGLPAMAVVGSIREVNWGRLSPNFLFVFSPGALDEAPQFHVFLAHTPDKPRSAEFQRKLVKQLPSVSVIDMTLVLRTVETLFRQIRDVTDYLALLAVLLGFAILLSSVSTSRFHRIQESVLFRTLGASRGHIQRITAMEYGIVATLGGLSGLLLASIGSQLLLHFMFEIRPVPDWTTLVCVLVGTVTVTVTLGLLLNRRVLKVSPLQIWRTET